MNTTRDIKIRILNKVYGDCRLASSGRVQIIEENPTIESNGNYRIFRLQENREDKFVVIYDKSLDSINIFKRNEVDNG